MTEMCGPCIRELWTDLGSFSFKDPFVPPLSIGCNVQFVWYLRFFSHQWGQDPFFDMKWTNLEVLAYRTKPIFFQICPGYRFLQTKLGMKPSPPESRKISLILWLTWYACRPFSVVKLRVIKFYPIGLQGVARFYHRNWISWGGDHWQCMFHEFNFLMDHINYEVSCSTATNGPLLHFLHSMKLIWQLHY